MQIFSSVGKIPEIGNKCPILLLVKVETYTKSGNKKYSY